MNDLSVQTDSNTASLVAATPVDVKSISTASPRLASIDAYRGFVMFLMIAEVTELRKIASNFPTSKFWSLLSYHQTHVEWIGCSLHDLIQPSFSFLVGVALPFSLASRLSRGQTKTRLISHAIWRSILLVSLGVFLRSRSSPVTNFTFEDTLSQIGLGYTFLFILGLYSTRAQWFALAIILVADWAAFALHPLPTPSFDFPSVGVPPTWTSHPHGFAGHWDKNSNLAWAFDTWFLNLFPRNSVFHYNGGGYATLSFIPTLATMILGLLAGGILRRPWSKWSKAVWLVIAGIISLLAGWSLGELGLCPVVKRIWTPSWVLYSGGFCFLFLATFFVVIDSLGFHHWSFPLRVIGVNSIAAYCMTALFDDFIARNLKIHLGHHAFEFLGVSYEPLLHGLAVVIVLWLILFWMYKRKIFIRL